MNSPTKEEVDLIMKKYLDKNEQENYKNNGIHNNDNFSYKSPTRTKIANEFTPIKTSFVQEYNNEDLLKMNQISYKDDYSQRNYANNQPFYSKSQREYPFGLNTDGNIYSAKQESDDALNKLLNVDIN